MKSYTQSIALLNSMTKVPTADTTNTTLLAQLWNDSVRTVCNIRGGKLRFLERTKDVNTVASQTGYQLPARFRKVIDLYVTVGTGSTATKYLPRAIYDPEQWNLILASNLGTNDVPFYYFVRNRTIEIQPIPATSDNVITIRGRLTTADATIADVTNITVVSITTATTAMVISGSGLASMAGKYIRITNTGAANTGDGFWYEIASATATTITLTAPYEGTTISAATTACTIAEMTPIPEAYDMAPIYRTLALFSQINDPLHVNVSNQYWKLYDGGQEAGLAALAALPGGLIGQMLENEGETTEGAYISPTRGVGGPWSGAPYWYPFQDASGF